MDDRRRTTGDRRLTRKRQTTDDRGLGETTDCPRTTGAIAGQRSSVLRPSRAPVNSLSSSVARQATNWHGSCSNASRPTPESGACRVAS